MTKPRFTLINIVWWKCNGDAHKPEVAGGMEHCGVCMPYWENVPTCHICGSKLISGKKYLRCTKCRHNYHYKE